MQTIKDIELAIQIFEENECLREAATEKGDYVIANKCYKKIRAAYVFLREQNALNLFYPFLNSDSIGVQLGAATYLLVYDEDIALKKLHEIASGTGINSLTAEMVIREWTNGNMVEFMKKG